MIHSQNNGSRIYENVLVVYIYKYKHSFIHSSIYIAPLQKGGYSEVLPTPARPNKTVFNLLNKQFTNNSYKAR